MQNSAAQYSVLLLCYVVDYSSPFSTSSCIRAAFIIISAYHHYIIAIIISLCRSAKKKNEKKVHMVADLGACS